MYAGGYSSLGDPAHWACVRQSKAVNIVSEKTKFIRLNIRFLNCIDYVFPSKIKHT